LKLWITGAKGLVATALNKLCRFAGISCRTSSKEEVDITFSDQVERFLNEERKITHIVNGAAYTSVDLAENQPESAYAVNVTGVKNLAAAAEKRGLWLLHLSTDYVFGQYREIPFKETDLCHPVNIYGKTKREGELAALSFQGACILRSSWIFGPGGKGFISSLWNRFQGEEKIYVIQDQTSRITYVEDLAQVILMLLNHTGIFHFANEGAVSRFEVAQYLFSLLPLQRRAKSLPALHPVSSSFFPQLAKRPSYSVLDTYKISSSLPLHSCDWRSAVRRYIESAL